MNNDIKNSLHWKEFIYAIELFRLIITAETATAAAITATTAIATHFRRRRNHGHRRHDYRRRQSTAAAVFCNHPPDGVVICSRSVYDPELQFVRLE